MGWEQDSSYYDKAFAERPQYGLDVDAEHSWHWDLYQFVAGLLSREEYIYELGCGSGQFAEYLLKNGYKYTGGCDFSSKGCEMAQARCKQDLFICANLLEIDYEDITCHTFICLEVLEHMEDDLDVIQALPKGIRFVASVPSFDDLAHVRFFNDSAEVALRYESYFSYFVVHKINRTFVIDCMV